MRAYAVHVRSHVLVLLPLWEVDLSFLRCDDLNA